VEEGPGTHRCAGTDRIGVLPRPGWQPDRSESLPGRRTPAAVAPGHAR
jgi:hypothetical protein